jgi:hypothetical protein
MDEMKISFDRYEIEHFCKLVFKRIQMLREEFIKTKRKIPEKLYIDWLTYKKIEFYNESFMFKIPKEETTFFGMIIEVLPYTENLIALGFNTTYENVSLGFSDYNHKGVPNETL